MDTYYNEINIHVIITFLPLTLCSFMNHIFIKWYIVNVPTFGPKILFLGLVSHSLLSLYLSGLILLFMTYASSNSVAIFKRSIFISVSLWFMLKYKFWSLSLSILLRQFNNFSTVISFVIYWIDIYFYSICLHF